MSTEYVPSSFVWVDACPQLLFKFQTLLSLEWLFELLTSMFVLVRLPQLYDNTDVCHQAWGKNYMNPNLTVQTMAAWQWIRCVSYWGQHWNTGVHSLCVLWSVLRTDMEAKRQWPNLHFVVHHSLHRSYLIVVLSAINYKILTLDVPRKVRQSATVSIKLVSHWLLSVHPSLIDITTWECLGNEMP